MGFWDQLRSFVTSAEQPVQPATFESIRDACVKSMRSYLGWQPEEMQRLGAIEKFQYHTSFELGNMAVHLFPRDKYIWTPQQHKQSLLMGDLRGQLNVAKLASETKQYQRLDEVVQQYRLLFATERKIHLQPRVKDIPIVWERLLAAIEKNENLRASIFAMKIWLAPDMKLSRQGDVVPKIILYTLDQGAFEKALAVLTASLRDCDQYAGGEPPRFNQKISELIYVAQSSGDLKGWLREAGLLDKYFDASTNYAFFKGERLTSGYIIEKDNPKA